MTVGCRKRGGAALWVAVCGALLMLSRAVQAGEPVVTVLADFNGPSVAASITTARNALVGDCAARWTAFPARGRAALELEIGATAANASVTCDLTFRQATRFEQADRVATFCWLNEGEMQVAFRVRDAQGQLFESPLQPVGKLRRWVYLAAELDASHLKRIVGSGPLTYPIEIAGYRVDTPRIGTQSIFLDELQVEHEVAPRDLVHGEFWLSTADGSGESTHIYESGASVAATIVLENRSRRRALDFSVDLAWIHPNGTVLQRQTGTFSLLAAGTDYRSYQKVEFAQVLQDPGLYRLVARARAVGWTAPHTFETNIVITPRGRRLTRGDSTFFAAHSNLLREAEIDQVLEISVARDIGVNLLALTASWERLEPKADRYDFANLTSVVDQLTGDSGMAVMLMITTPPPWVSSDPVKRSARLAGLIGALAKQFGTRLETFQVSAEALGAPTLAAQLEAAAELRAKVGEAHARATVLPPAVAVSDAAQAPVVREFLRAHSGQPMVFRSGGEPEESYRALEAFRREAGFKWQAVHWWIHEAAPAASSGTSADAEAVLRYYVHAATAGVGGLIWANIRDEDNDPRHPDALRGLVRRDFSPRTSLLGYATAAGQLTGYQYAGPATPLADLFDSALFIGGNRQVAILLPRPNRLLPAALAVNQRRTGDLEVQDSDRQPHPVLLSDYPALVPTVPKPLFVTLTLQRPEPKPVLELTTAWLRAPRTVFCGAGAEFQIELDARTDLNRSYLQLKLPDNAPFQSSFSAAGLTGVAGDTIRRSVQLTLKPRASDFERAALELRVSLESTLLELPLELRTLAEVRRRAGGGALDVERNRLGRAVSPAGRRASAELVVLAAYAPDALVLELVLSDDRIAPWQAVDSGQSTGDDLLVGVARADDDLHAEARITGLDGTPTLTAHAGTSAGQIQGWRCEALAPGPDGERRFQVTVPTHALGDKPLGPGDLVRLAVRYVDDDADGFPAVPISWGEGLEGTHSSEGFRWVRLAGE